MRLQSRRISHALPPTFLQYICKNTKNIQKVDYMDGFCWQGELDLTLFYHFYPMQLVTPSVVAIAVSMLMAI